MKKLICAGIALSAAVMAVPAAAATEMRPYFNGGVEYVLEDKDRASDAGEGFWFGAGKPLNEYWGLDISTFHNQFDGSAATGGRTWREFGGKLDGLFFYSREAGFQPYVGLGVGAMRNVIKSTPGGGGTTEPFADAGLGFFKYFDGGNSDYGVRGDVRYRWTDADISGIGSFAEPVVKIGLVMALGDRPAPERDAEAVSIEARRAAEAAALAAVPGGVAISSGVPKANDADGDGILDDTDNCPGTTGSVVVDARGCAVDGDRDGVADNLDRCPATPAGLAVDAKGCTITSTAAGAIRSFENVNFAFDRSELTDYAKATLDNAASVIGELARKYPGLKVEVSGHTDWIGTDAYNQALSERRANVVRDYLARKGVDSKSVDTFSYGESKPIAPNDTDEGRALNRRAEVRTHE